MERGRKLFGAGKKTFGGAELRDLWRKLRWRPLTFPYYPTPLKIPLSDFPASLAFARLAAVNSSRKINPYMSYAVEVVKKLQISCEIVVKRKLREWRRVSGESFWRSAWKKIWTVENFLERSGKLFGAGKKSFGGAELRDLLEEVKMALLHSRSPIYPPENTPI